MNSRYVFAASAAASEPPEFLVLYMLQLMVGIISLVAIVYLVVDYINDTRGEETVAGRS